MPNYNPKTAHLPKQKPRWKHLPTKAIRVPEIFLGEIEAIAQQMDNGEQISLQCTEHSDLEKLLRQIKSLELEDLLKVQLELPLIIEEKREQVCDRRLEKAILFLAGRCDGAYSQDGLGFNGSDVGFGHWLADRLEKNQLLLI